MQRFRLFTRSFLKIDKPKTFLKIIESTTMQFNGSSGTAIEFIDAIMPRHLAIDCGLIPSFHPLIPSFHPLIPSFHPLIPSFHPLDSVFSPA
jgi:hypothetical protein